LSGRRGVQQREAERLSLGVPGLGDGAREDLFQIATCTGLAAGQPDVDDTDTYREQVESWGGRVVRLRELPGVRTTRILAGALRHERGG